MSIDSWMDKEVVVHIYNGILAIKRHASESVLVRWMNLERVIQSEVREKQISYVNTYIWNPEGWYWWTHLQGRNRDTVRGQTCGYSGGRRGWDKYRVTLKHKYYHMLNRQLVGSCWATQDPHRCAVMTERGGMWWGLGGRLKTEGTYVYLWLLHADIWQIPTRFHKAIFLQLKTKTKTRSTIWSSNPTPRLISRKKITPWGACIFSHTCIGKMCAPHVHSSTVYNSQDVEATHVTINRWMDKMWHVYIHKKIKKNEPLPFAAMWMDLQDIITLSEVRQKKTNTVWYRLICGI